MKLRDWTRFTLYSILFLVMDRMLYHFWGVPIEHNEGNLVLAAFLTIMAAIRENKNDRS